MQRAALIPELYVRDLGTTLRVYDGILLFSVLYARPDEGFASLRRDDAEIMVEELWPNMRAWLAGSLKVPFARGINLQILVASVDTLYRRVVSADASIFLPLEDHWYAAGDTEIAVRQFMVVDPDGYLLRFSQRLATRGKA